MQTLDEGSQQVLAARYLIRKIYADHVDVELLPSPLAFSRTANVQAGARLLCRRVRSIRTRRQRAREQFAGLVALPAVFEISQLIPAGRT